MRTFVIDLDDPRPIPAHYTYVATLLINRELGTYTLKSD